MFKPSLTVLKDRKGKTEVLVCSEDATECLDAFAKCDKPGEVVYIRKGTLEKRKKNPSKDLAKGRGSK